MARIYAGQLGDRDPRLHPLLGFRSEVGEPASGPLVLHIAGDSTLQPSRRRATF
ncbi:hypothetical protein GCM10023094_12480 [Rhodococcus olei]|uniref:Uncharacterized protein n=1 Tax=Rhodococcus olei TaxID=2161675 RepID=A0ABP8NZM1_9NOCA